MNRRGWMLFVTATLSLSRSLQAQATLLTGEEEELRKGIESRAKEAGIRRLSSKASAHFLAMSDASPTFVTRALAICEDLLADFLEFYGSRMFSVQAPGHRLPVVILSNLREVARFLDEDAADAYPCFDHVTNRLVFFDMRADRAPARGRKERGNTITLGREAGRMIMFNTGLLNLDADLPYAIEQGLAECLEFRPPSGRWPVDRPNHSMIMVLAEDAKQAWIPVERLLVDDAALEDDANMAFAYAVSWVLANHLIRSKVRVPQLRAYLQAVNGRRDSSLRLEDARTHFGDLGKLDAEVRQAVEAWRAYWERLPASAKVLR